MPLTEAFGQNGVIRRLRRIRGNRVASYGLTVGFVAIATGLRYAVHPDVISGLPFITYFPAIILAALFGGFGPGVVSIALSVVIAWYFFLPPLVSWTLDPHSAFTLLFFVLIALINVVIVHWLNVALEHVIGQHDNIRTLIEASPNGIVVVNDRGEITLVNSGAERLFGYTRSEMVGKKVEMLVPKHAGDRHVQLREGYLLRPEARLMGMGRDLNGRRADNSEFPVEIGLNPIRSGGRTAVLATVIDITTRKRVQDHQRLLLAELQHRTKNLFVVIQAIASETLKGRSIAEARIAFNARVHALAQAYAAVADAAWEGASVEDVIRRQLASYAGQLHVTGCKVFVTVDAAQQLALIFHELATNAVKYGAWSNAEGQVMIEGRVDDPGSGEAVFVMWWKERGGPRVSPPLRKGFGSTILVDAARQFGDARLAYEPSGLEYELRVPLREIAPAPSQIAG